MKCASVTAAGHPCSARALPATEPPACVAHASANGRHCTRDEATTRRLLLHLRAAGAVGESLAACGVSRSTFYVWMRDEAFAKRVREARDDGRLRVLTLLSAPRDWQGVALQIDLGEGEAWGLP